MSSNHTKAHSLEEGFRDVESVDLVGLGHDGVLGLDVAFRHGCAMSLKQEGKLRLCAMDKGRGRELPAGRRDGSLGQLNVSTPGKGLGGTLALPQGPKLKLLGTTRRTSLCQSGASSRNRGN